MERALIIILIVAGALAAGCTNSTRGGAVGVNANGVWEVTETLSTNDCGEAPGTQRIYDVEVEQRGSDITVYTPVGSYDGELDGRTLEWSGSYPDQGGITTIDGMTLTIDAANPDFLSGQSDWTWEGSGIRCSGVTLVTAHRTSAPVTAAPEAPITDAPAWSTGDSCIDTVCSAELSQCGAECQQLAACVTSCATDACFDACASSSSHAAVDQLVTLAICAQDFCSGE